MSAGRHKEKTFEDEVVAHLTAHGWLLGESAQYDRALALYPEDVLGWLAETQPKELAKVAAPGGGSAGPVVVRKLAEALDRDGTLRVLRRGFKHVNARFEMCQFRPSQGLNPETLARYGLVRCRVVRQLRYSANNDNSLDLAFFVNGIPVATAELKTDFTQSLHDAIRQYKHDRPPRDPYAKQDEPLLAFKRRALVHFAVGTGEVAMATRLAGSETVFLPFNLGNDGGRGNPPNPDGYPTAYLWERVWRRDSLLDILGNFVHLETKEVERPDGTKAQREALIFPRYHQWDAVGALVDAARREGPGHDYLIQHSAGSGKSNTIAWLAHRLATLHDDQDRKVFGSVIVVTDRTVLDSQLQETIYQFEHKVGVVVPIKDEGPSKSEQLAQALKGNAPIIIVTLQTFPFVLDAIRKETSLKDRTFAVIADEAHSSQTGSAASNLAKVLTAEQIAEGEEVAAEDILLAGMAARAEHRTVSYFAFTATPKAKTIERFGRSPAPGQPPEPFHVYTMQQAIEEGFILDVLRNYTGYKLAFKLAHDGAEYDDGEVEQGRALKSLMRWVRLHPHNIAQKVQIIVEHFRQNVLPLLGGQAKAMVVTGSRKEAVRYKLALDKYVRAQGYTDVAALVAFSGEVHDAESGPEPFSERGMNPGLKGRDLRDAFDTNEYSVLIVANKYQTGFDQPKLCAMYVDKRLDGITAVQTLSRLNRTYPGKEATYVLDFVNEPEDILAAFTPYYRRAELADVTDPNLIHALQNKLDDAQLYTEAEVVAFVRAYLDPQGKQAALHAHLQPAVSRFKVRWNEATAREDKQALDVLEVFRKDVATLVRLYDFLSQIINYGDTDLEARAIFLRLLAPLLATERLGEEIDLSSVHLTQYRLKDQGARALLLGEGGGDYRLQPLGEAGSGVGRDPVRARLSAIVAQMNELFDGDFTEADYLTFAHSVRDKMVENPALRQQAAHNTKEQFALGEFQAAMVQAIVANVQSHGTMARQVFAKDEARTGFAAVLLDLVWETLRDELPKP